MQGSSKVNMSPAVPAPSPGLKRQVVYAPACVTRMMGPARGDTEQASVHDKLLSLFQKAGYEVIYPKVHHTSSIVARGTELDKVFSWDV